MPRQIGGLQARVEWVGAAAYIAAMRALPLDRAVRVGSKLGRIAMEVDRFNRPIALKNLEIAFPDLTIAQRLAILRGAYRNWGRMAAEWSHIRKLNRSNIEDVVTYEGKEHWDEAERISKGRGIIVLTAHFGNWELLNVAHSVYGYRIGIVNRVLRNPLMDKQVRAARVSFGNALIERKTGGMTAMRLLRKNWQIAITLDLDVRKGVFVDFFGLPASTSDGLARLALATGAPVVPTFMVRQGAGARNKITIHPAIEIQRTDDRAADIVENTQRFVRPIEAMIRAHPDHWNWIHRRWKTRPPGEQRFY
ncbi:MAG TPA: lysophospholipid acyltransferase family protein [Candidatus Binataceae bacterium]|nr:lysophospholipid acyltransferase family protein [Candidatus Binataceae bacterium]